MNCKFCEKLCVNKRSLSHHERTCPLNPERNYKNGMEGKVAWNSGLIKKDSAGLESMARKNSKTMKDKMEQGLKTPFVKSWWSEERKKKASDQKKKFFEKIRKNIQTEFFLKIELECHTQKKLLLTG